MNRMIMTVMAAGLLAAAGQAAADETVPDTGQIYVYGELQENTCRLEMDSADQAVDMGATARADVGLMGKTARPVTVRLYLRDCPQMSSWSTNITPMTETTSTQQPSYRARFVAKADAANPSLIAVTGASGIGLRLKDSRGQTVRLSRESDTLLLAPGQDQLTFTLAPERTAAPFRVGAYHALINFNLFYE